MLCFATFNVLNPGPETALEKYKATNGKERATKPRKSL
jgi:hypothetical protein